MAPDSELLNWKLLAVQVARKRRTSFDGRSASFEGILQSSQALPGKQPPGEQSCLRATPDSEANAAPRELAPSLSDPMADVSVGNHSGGSGLGRGSSMAKMGGAADAAAAYAAFAGQSAMAPSGAACMLGPDLYGDFA